MNTRNYSLILPVIIICFYCSPGFSMGPNTLPSDPEEQIRLSINELAYNLYEINPDPKKDACNCQLPEIPKELAEIIQKDTLTRDTKKELEDFEAEKEQIKSQWTRTRLEIVRAEAHHKGESSSLAEAQKNYSTAMSLARGGGTQGYSQRMDASIDRSEKKIEEAKANAAESEIILSRLRNQQRRLEEKFAEVHDKQIKLIKRLKTRVITQRALLVSDWEFLDFTKITNLVPRDSWGSMTSILRNGIAVGNLQQTEKLINMGADTYNGPGEYSNLALAKALGYTDLVPRLKDMGGTIEVPWAPFPSQRAVNDQKFWLSLENRWKRISEFNSLLHQQKLNPFYEYNKDLLNALRCRINCLKLAYSNKP